MKKRILLSILSVFLLSNTMALAAVPSKEEVTSTLGKALLQTAVTKIDPEYILQIDSLFEENNPLINDLKESAKAVKEGYESWENKDTAGLVKNILVLKENEDSLKKVWNFLEVDRLLAKLQN
ncbi:MAG: hypothetical protein ACI3ZR_07450 [bacterium]